jgi:hypothetical protein
VSTKALWRQVITELGATVEHGINWAWALWPITDSEAKDKAEQFDKWCTSHGYETRGVYPPHNNSGYGVRFR